MNTRFALRIASGLALALGLNATASASRNPGIDNVRFQDIRTVHYQCDGGSALTVRYFNSPDNRIAILRMPDKTLLTVNVISGSGARYVGDRYEWWTKGNEGTLRDLMEGENGPPVLSGCHATT